METKEEIVKDWLPRYTGRPLEEFGEYILLVNFQNYVHLFAEQFGVPVVGEGKPMQSASAENITIINFGMGSAMAATVMDLLSAVQTQGVDAVNAALPTWLADTSSSGSGDDITVAMAYRQS